MLPGRAVVFKQTANHALYLGWLLIPTLIISATFHRVLLAIDVLAFALVESFLPRRAVFWFRLVWIILLLILVLAWWNIPPRAYGFYLSAVVAVPLAIKLFAAMVVAILAVFLCSRLPPAGNAATWRAMFLVSLIVVVVKSLCTWLAPLSAIHLRPLVTVVPSAMRVLALDARPNGANKFNAARTPTFFNYLAHQSALPDKTVLLVVESWGESEASLARLTDSLKAHQVVVQDAGLTTFRGATLQGEFRELCAEFVDLAMSSFSPAVKRHCAPEIMRERQYELVALHGYSKHFYARSMIWASLGFKEMYFEEELSRLKHCGGPFPGVCDKELIVFGVDLLMQRQRAFLYMLSLSSHEPVASNMAAAVGPYFASLPSDTAAQRVARNAVSALVAKLQASGNGGCVAAYVVGDHPPPSSGVALGGTGALKVPYMALRFHCAGQAGAL